MILKNFTFSQVLRFQNKWEIENLSPGVPISGFKMNLFSFNQTLKTGRNLKWPLWAYSPENRGSFRPGAVFQVFLWKKVESEMSRSIIWNHPWIKKIILNAIEKKKDESFFGGDLQLFSFPLIHKLLNKFISFQKGSRSELLLHFLAIVRLSFCKTG